MVAAWVVVAVLVAGSEAGGGVVAVLIAGSVVAELVAGSEAAG
jgi:hypothetical protein